MTKLAKYVADKNLSIAEFQRSVKPYVSYQTVFGAVKGVPIRNLRKAIAISEATGGAVTVQDLA